MPTPETLFERQAHQKELEDLQQKLDQKSKRVKELLEVPESPPKKEPKEGMRVSGVSTGSRPQKRAPLGFQGFWGV